MEGKNFQETEYSKMPPTEAARKIVLKGYRQTSRRSGILARVDLSDKELVEFAMMEDLVRLESLKNHYRRCYSEDKIENVPEEVMDLVREYGNKIDLR